MFEPSEYFVLDGTMKEDAPSYIERPADRELLEMVERGKLCLIFAPRQTGKSSLIVRTAARLRENGINAGIIDLQRYSGQKKSDVWFGAVVNQIKRSFELTINSNKWWETYKNLDAAQRFSNFLEDVVLSELKGNVVLLFDEIDSVLSVPFSDDFFTTLRSIYNYRAHNSILRRLTFVLVGTVRTDALIKAKQRTPFNVGSLIDLGDLEREKLNKYNEVLGENSREVIDHIFYWTNGQPILVQRLANAYTSMQKSGKRVQDIDNYVKDKYLDNKRLIENDMHFAHIQNQILGDKRVIRRVLIKYRDILEGNDIVYNDKDYIQSQLKLSGIVRVEEGKLVIHNRIYQQVFDFPWIEEHLPGELNIKYINFKKGIKYSSIGAAIGVGVGLISYLFPKIKGLFADSSVAIAAFGAILSIFTLVFSIYLSKKAKKGALEAEFEFVQDRKFQKEKTSLKRYREALRRELGFIGVMGPGFESIRVPVQETFIDLRISDSLRFRDNLDKKGAREMLHLTEATYLSPNALVKRAFEKHRLLLVIGDPGSGKTTLLKYYSMLCLYKKQDKIGLGKRDILPIFFPLRELIFEGNRPIAIHQNLESWARKRHLDISASEFHSWLEKGNTLVLLDGLDEIDDTEKRRQACRWIENVWAGFGNALFVLTSRPTGYRKMDNLELEIDYLHCDIMDFTPQQQEAFLYRWFHTVYMDELSSSAGKEEKRRKEMEAMDRARAISIFLAKEENKNLRELARVPMLLQIMAIIWKDRDYLPESRQALYDISLNYLLEYRDRRRQLIPFLPASHARLVLAPTALWMQEVLRSDFAPKKDIHITMQRILDQFDRQPDARSFCENLRDRAGVIADYGSENYIFRHKSFMEFLAATQLLKKASTEKKTVAKLVENFKDPWWEETLRFFMGMVDGEIFDLFMLRFFESKASRELDNNNQNLLQLLVRNAPQRKIDSLVSNLFSGKVNENQKRYILNCLKTINTPESIEAVETFIQENKGDTTTIGLARDIAAEACVEIGVKVDERGAGERFVIASDSFRNVFEDNVEYIQIPGGTYMFSVSKKLETVPDIHFCKYPVTNKRYRRFLSYLKGKQETIEKFLPLNLFSNKLLEFAKGVKGYSDYLGTNPDIWGNILRSRFDEEKRLNGDDQPVVGVSWYAARAYCFWLSCMHWQTVTEAGKTDDLIELEQLATTFRLPTEVEWEWAAVGRESDGSFRKYSWANIKGEPNPNLANYDENVGSTTPVGRYPEGATPEGLMDMSGNVWEWMENFYDQNAHSYALRGGSWFLNASLLRCVSRFYNSPHYGWKDYSFRVIAHKASVNSEP